ncbi:hypothetical protein FACS189491_04850 [Spirochaetia bacterium]|nr:hypothetical protein FACS189491_04850 [Spirochaetia bacterium]
MLNMSDAHTHTRVHNALLAIDGLSTSFHTGRGILKAVDGVSFHVEQGEILGLVGESGCGKSVTAHSILRLYDEKQQVSYGGKIFFNGRDILNIPYRQMRQYRGQEIAMVFQESSLNPVFTAGDQIAESIRIHRHMKKAETQAQVLDLLDMVGIPDPAKRIHQFPHELSGGMRQRIMLAIALACSPRLLIADEPTTALDVTIQAQIMSLILDLNKRLNMGVILITHDLSVVAETCGRVAVMYLGQIVEEAPATELFGTPQHPYTQGLLKSIPRINGSKDEKLSVIPGAVPLPDAVPPGCRFADRCPYAESRCREETQELRELGSSHKARCWRAAGLHQAWRRIGPNPSKGFRPILAKDSVQSWQRIQSNPGKGFSPILAQDSAPSWRGIPPNTGAELILDVRDLVKYFPLRNTLGRVINQVKAVDGISLSLYRGETYGLVGETGCGKSTLGRTIIRLLDPTSGSVMFDKRDITSFAEKELRPIRRNMQMVFQDPVASLNPRIRVGDMLLEVLKIHKIGKDSGDRIALVLEIMDKVGLRAEHFYRYPHEFSGGQQQRIGLARALILSPRLVICDEPVSALDVSIRSQIINLLLDLQKQGELTYLFIAHDISVVKYISDRIGVMYLGRLVETAPRDELFSAPLHPYTQALLSSVPEPDPRVRKERAALTGDLPSPINPPAGCAFHTRCPKALPVCARLRPVMGGLTADKGLGGSGHGVACHLYNCIRSTQASSSLGTPW